VGLIRRLFGARGPEPGARLEALHGKLASFLRPSHALVDPAWMNVPEKRERYALFVYGAATELAATRDLGETEALALLLRSLGEDARMNEHEVSHLVGRVMTLSATPTGAAACERGAAAARDWLGDDPGKAVTRLAEVLAE
jgi:hypothetical protein